MSITTMTFAARDFSARRGASDEHTLQGSVRNEQRSLAEKNCRPKGCAAFGLWLRCSSVTDPLRDMLPPRALPQAKFDATNVIVIMFMTTKTLLHPARFTGCKLQVQSFERGTCESLNGRKGLARPHFHELALSLIAGLDATTFWVLCRGNHSMQ